MFFKDLYIFCHTSWHYVTAVCTTVDPRNTSVEKKGRKEGREEILVDLSINILIFLIKLYIQVVSMWHIPKYTYLSNSVWRAITEYSVQRHDGEYRSISSCSNMIIKFHDVRQDVGGMINTTLPKWLPTYLESLGHSGFTLSFNSQNLLGSNGELHYV